MTYGSALQMLLHYAKKYWYRFVFIFFCALVAGVIDIYAPFLIGEAIDYMVSGNVYFSGIYQILLILLLLYAVQGVFKYLLQLHSAKAAHLVANRMRHLNICKLFPYNIMIQRRKEISSAALSMMRIPLRTGFSRELPNFSLAWSSLWGHWVLCFPKVC